jgi:hypothetical protein
MEGWRVYAKTGLPSSRGEAGMPAKTSRDAVPLGGFSSRRRRLLAEDDRQHRTQLFYREPLRGFSSSLAALRACLRIEGRYRY